MTAGEWVVLGPVLALLGAAFAAVAVDVMAPGRDRTRTWILAAAYVGLFAAIALLAAPLFLPAARSDSIPVFSGALVGDALSTFVSAAVLLAAVLALPVAVPSMAARGVPVAEFVALLLSSAAGMVLLAMSHDLITMFLSIEILSLALYVLCGMARRDPKANESAMKYFVLGAFATGFLLYGMTLLYGATGTVFLDEMAARASGNASPLLVGAGLALLVAGFAFKVGAVPFHMWVPDVYEGAATPVTAYMSVAVKAAGFGALLRLLLAGLPAQVEAWGPVVWALAALTMVVANLGALAQESVKRMLAYSSVAHTGYALVGVVAAAGPEPMRSAGASAALFYTLAYLVMTLGAFVFLMFAGDRGREAETYADLAGLARRRPWAAAIMTVLMVSLAGIPPTVGFVGKFMLFQAAVDAGHVALAVLGVVTSVVSVYYYLRVVVVMYMAEAGAETPVAQPVDGPPMAHRNAGWTAAIGAALTLFLGLYPNVWLDFARLAIDRLRP